MALDFLDPLSYKFKEDGRYLRSMLIDSALTSLIYSDHTISFYTPLNRRGKPGGASTSSREANIDEGISIIII